MRSIQRCEVRGCGDPVDGVSDLCAHHRYPGQSEHAKRLAKARAERQRERRAEVRKTRGAAVIPLPTRKADVLVSGDAGPMCSVFLVRPVSAAAKAWLAKNVIVEPWQYFGGAIGVEHRYIGDLVAGMRADGLVVR